MAGMEIRKNSPNLLSVFICVHLWFQFFPLALLGAEPAEDIDRLEQEAFRRAMDHVSPCVVRIETVGGLERVERVLKGAGPTTGLVVGEDGWILSSSFNLAHRPAGILVTLDDGRRFPARVVGIDHNKKLILLKTNASDLPVPEAVPKSEMRIGQWSLALGRTWDLERPSISVGIVSALDRIWAKAIQTDAKVSPVNYGGPLIDLSGRVLGILVPLSPQSTSKTAGVEWYDSGIGFAIPLEDVFGSLERLNKGDLYPGLLGIEFESTDLYVGVPTIHQVAWRSPAEGAGLRKQDQVVAVDESPVRRLAELRQTIGGKYAGDSVKLSIRRKDQTLPALLVLAEKFPTYVQPLIGFLPDQGVKREGVGVREVLSETPAEAAGLKPADVVIGIGGETVKDRAALEKLLDEYIPGESVTLEVQRGDRSLDLAIKLTSFPNQIPAAIPRPVLAAPNPFKNLGGTHQRKTKLGEYWIHVPEDYRPDTPHGLVLWFGGKGGPKREDVLAAWKDVCQDWNFLFVGTPPQKSGAWQTSDFPKIIAALEDVKRSFTIDDAKIIVHGTGNGGIAAQGFTRDHRQWVRGVFIYGGGILPARATHPSEKLAYCIFWSSTDPRAQTFPSSAERLRKQGYPVATRGLALGAKGYPTSQDLQEVGRWIELLGAL